MGFRSRTESSNITNRLVALEQRIKRAAASASSQTLRDRHQRLSESRVCLVAAIADARSSADRLNADTQRLRYAGRITDTTQLDALVSRVTRLERDLVAQDAEMALAANELPAREAEEREIEVEARALFQAIGADFYRSLRTLAPAAAQLDELGRIAESGWDRLRNFSREIAGCRVRDLDGQRGYASRVDLGAALAGLDD